MRSTDKDSSRYITLKAIINVLAGADQTGCFSDGTPWRSIRVSAGQYDIHFDPRLMPLNGFVGEIEQTRQYIWITALSPGFAHVRVMLHDASQTDASFDLNLNCVDTRV